MENAVVQQIRKRITRSKFGEIFFVSSFPQYDVEYVTKLLAIFEKEGLVTRIAKGVYVKPRKTRFGILYPTAYELVKEIAKRDKAGQQDGQRQRHGHEREAAVVEKLAQHVPREALADEFLHITPHKLHHEDEEADEERACEKQQVGLQDECIELANKSHVCVARAYAIIYCVQR